MAELKTTPGVTLITPTGMRPESLRLCAFYVYRFFNPDGLPVQWIVVDDGPVESHVPLIHDPNIHVKYVRPGHRWERGRNTLALNLLEAIPLVRHDNVIFCEDDDWYDADYMAAQLERLRSGILVGETNARYYHVPTAQYRLLENTVHASLCQTAMRSQLLPALRDICTRPAADFIDCRLWSTVDRPVVLAATSHCVGMKGMPGRPGIGIGHRPHGVGWKPDPDRKTLREWLGVDAGLYLGAKTPSRAAVGVA